MAIDNTLSKVAEISQTIEQLLPLLFTPIGVASAVIVVTSMVFGHNWHPLIELLASRSRRRLDLLDRHATGSRSSDEPTQATIADIRDAWYFHASTGIYAESKLRNSLIDLHRKTSYRVSWKVIRRAREFLSVGDDGAVAVRNFTLADRVELWLNRIAGLVFILMFVVVYLSIFTGAITGVGSMAVAVAFGLLAFVLFLYALSQTLPYRDAVLLSKEITELVHKNPTPPREVDPTRADGDPLAP